MRPLETGEPRQCLYCAAIRICPRFPCGSTAELHKGCPLSPRRAVSLFLIAEEPRLDRGSASPASRLWPVFFSRFGRGFDHRDSRSSFWIDPSDGRSGTKRPKQEPVACLANFLRALRLVDRLSNPMRLTGCLTEHFRGRLHAVFNSSAICWFLTQKERPQLVAWQRPLLPAAEGVWLGSGQFHFIRVR